MFGRFNKVLSMVMAAVLLVSCLSFAVSAADGTSVYKYSEMGSSMKLISRAVMKDNTVQLTMSASGAQTNVVCSGNVTLNYKWTGYPGYLGVFVDGTYTRYTNTRSDSGEERQLVIAKDLVQGEHNIKVVKCNEFHDLSGNLLNRINLISLSFAGSLGSAPAAGKMKIEFYGDSLTAAMGNLGTSSTSLTSDNFGLNQDVYSGYAYYTAEKFDADYCVMASSGEGIVKGYGNDSRNTWDALHSYADPFEELKWNDGDFDADVVVINLGANDTFNKMINAGTYTDMEFSQAAYNILKYIRDYNSDCKIIWLFPIPSIVMSYIYPDCINGIEMATQCFSNCTFYAMTPEDYGVTDIDEFLDGMDIQNLDYDKLMSKLKGASAHPDAEQHHFYSDTLTALINSVCFADEFEVDASGCLTKYNGDGGNIIVPDTVKSIADRVFRDTNISSIVIPDSVESFGNNVFPLNPSIRLYCSCYSPAISKYSATDGIKLVYTHKHCTINLPESVSDSLNQAVYATCSDCGNKYVPVYYKSGNLNIGSLNETTLELAAPEIDCSGASLRLFESSIPQALRFGFKINVPANATVTDFGALFANSATLGGSSDSLIFKDNAYNLLTDNNIDIDLLKKDSDIKMGSVSYSDGTLKSYNTFKTADDKEFDADFTGAADEDYYIKFNMAITGIASTNYASSRIARAYVTYVLYGKTYTVYDDCASARNIKYVAEAVAGSASESEYAKSYVKNNVLNYE